MFSENWGTNPLHASPSTEIYYRVYCASFNVSLPLTTEKFKPHFGHLNNARVFLWLLLIGKECL